VKSSRAWEYTSETMATITPTSIAEYLQTTYRPDCEYIDGEIRERNVGKWEHARVQWLLAVWFGKHEQAWGITGSTEQRMQVSPSRIRVPDLVVLTPGPQPDVLIAPPLLVIEVLSPDDTYSDTQERAQDYWNMGVKTVWIVDPKTRTGRMCSGAEWIASSRLHVTGTPLYVELDEIFRRIG
jgi:Uma2 family endonuclease